MPIVTRPTGTEPLAQGDVLKDVSFLVLDREGNAASQKAKYVIVLSRDCNSIRDPHVIVAPVSEWKLDIKGQLATASDGASIDRVRRVLSGVRDGGQVLVDRFYLGCLDDGSNNRFAADLSMMATIQVPGEKAEREKWVADHRVWRLTPDFGRDLHARLFNCFARMGFDDDSWFCDPDLELLINEGQQQQAAADAAVLEAERAIQEKETRNENVPPAMKTEVEKRKKAAADVKTELAAYQAEKAKRAQAK